MSDLRDRVEAALAHVVPAIRMDGGEVDLVDVDEAEGVVRLRLGGQCMTCGPDAIVLTLGVERAIRTRVPEVTRVERVN